MMIKLLPIPVRANRTTNHTSRNDPIKFAMIKIELLAAISNVLVIGSFPRWPAATTTLDFFERRDISTMDAQVYRYGVEDAKETKTFFHFR